MIRFVADEVDSARAATVDLLLAGPADVSTTSMIPPAFEGDVILMDGTGEDSRHEDVSDDAVAVFITLL